MELFSIASGSSGNCICVGNDRNHVMIDVGIPKKRVEEGMQKFDLLASDMDGILITHEHSDHIAGLGVISRKYALPIYATRGTIEAIKKSKSLGQIDPSLFHVICPDVDFTIGELTIHPIRIRHDARDPVAYALTDGKKKVSVLTDLGCYDDYIIENIKGSHLMLLEANHDLNMLRVGPYPYYLKQRISGEYGHLSNESSGKLLSDVLHDDVSHVLLGHLSKENNYEDLAYETVNMEITMGDNPYRGSDFPITVASRTEVSERLVC
ncbi:MAG: MBL fold metallo-hydrolase [Lachnospiraceae bacterium]|nr:MBL fold metallo-hydrolase [Lachnospiraceae bacterium]